MLIGQEELKERFKRLTGEGRLSHSYIFFGEPQVGKYSFALSLANFLEKGEFKQVETENGMPKTILEETLVLSPTGDSIGIDEIREAKHFFSQKPVRSEHRIVIINRANLLTQHAQNSALKIAEESPKDALLILITPSTDSLIETLKSRFQKIHFPRVETGKIAKLLEDEYGLDKKRAEDIATLSLGRPGRAVSLVTDEAAKERFKQAVSLLAGKQDKRKLIEEVLESEEGAYPLMTEIIAKLANDPVKNYDTLRSITDRMTVMSQFSVNKRLQLETALWNI